MFYSCIEPLSISVLRNFLNHAVFHSVATTDIPVSSRPASSNNMPDNLVVTSNLTGDSNVARQHQQQQQQQCSFHLQAEIIETGIWRMLRS
jgi:hypothetical protein